MTSNQTSSIATQLWQARQSGALYDSDGHPASLEEAYGLQLQATAASGQTVNGYKVGATTDEIMQMLGLDEPFFGPLYESFTRSQGATVKVYPEHQPKVEAEFAVCLKQGVSAAANPVTMDELLAAVDWVAPAFELIGTRFKDTPSGRGICTVADFGSNLDFIVGDHYTQWQQLELDSHAVTLRINGSEVANGNSGMSKAGSPLAVLLWLANHPLLSATGIAAGHIISCGTCTGAVAIAPGDILEADYGSLGILTTTIEAG